MTSYLAMSSVVLPCCLLLLLGAGGEPPPERPGTPAAEVFVAARELAGGAGAGPDRFLRFLDARSAADRAVGHLPGALACDVPAALEERGAAAVGERLGACGLTGEEEVVLYGDERSYGEIGRLFWLLEWAGQRRVRVLDGGVRAWLAAGGGLETGRPAERRTRFIAPARPSAAADPRWLAGLAGEPGVAVLDLRDGSGWQGPSLRAPPRFAAGHLPHALPFDFRGLLPGDGTWPDRLRVVEAVGRLGPRPGTSIDLRGTLVLHGAGADEAHPGLGYLLLRGIGADARVLPGGFAAWTRSGGAVVRIVPAAELAELLAREGRGRERDLRPRGLLLFDVRAPGAARFGHLPGATAVPMERFTRDFEAAVEEGWPGVDRARVPIVFYCYDRGCIRSRDACAGAARAGFRTILWLRDGIEGWREAGYPLAGAP